MDISSFPVSLRNLLCLPMRHLYLGLPQGLQEASISSLWVVLIVVGGGSRGPKGTRHVIGSPGQAHLCGCSFCLDSSCSRPQSLTMMTMIDMRRASQAILASYLQRTGALECTQVQVCGLGSRLHRAHLVSYSAVTILKFITDFD